MTSPRRVVSNRANAQKSTGPRSRAGKARAARNAFKHGLATPVILDRDTAAQVLALAQALAGERASDPAIWACAQQIAEAEYDLVRIRRTYVDTWNREAVAHNPSAKPKKGRLKPIGDAVGRYKALCDLLAKIERYERRALSRRRTALQRLAQIWDGPSAMERS